MFRLGIDLGGTSARVALVDGAGRVVRSVQVPTSAKVSATKISNQLGSVAKEMARGRGIKTLGVGVAGDINFEQGIVRISPNLGWKNVPLRKLLQKSSRLKVIVDNDANAAAW